MSTSTLIIFTLTSFVCGLVVGYYQGRIAVLAERLKTLVSEEKPQVHTVGSNARHGGINTRPMTPRPEGKPTGQGNPANPYRRLKSKFEK